MLPYCGFHISNIMRAPMVYLIPGSAIHQNRHILSHGAPRFSRPGKISMSTSSEIGFPLPPDTRFDSGWRHFECEYFSFCPPKGIVFLHQNYASGSYRTAVANIRKVKIKAHYRSRPRNRRTLHPS